jgi:pyrroline-5-carboxylate reductase
MKTIGMIGGGNMGAAIVNKIRRKYSVSVVEKDPAKCKILKYKYKVVCGGLGSIVERANTVILAIKPQDFDTMLYQLRGLIRKDHLLISIAAGVTTQYIEKRLGPGIRVIRAMPNLPAQIGEAMTGMCKGKFASTNDLKEAVKIFDHIGKTIEVQEKWIDCVTAVSGSGPAYVFLFVEIFTNAAKNLGFSPEQAKLLVDQTLRGSLDLLEESNEDAGALRARVTSKGGTTQAALEVFEQANYEKIFKDALLAAQKRAKELSKS